MEATWRIPTAMRCLRKGQHHAWTGVHYDVLPDMLVHHFWCYRCGCYMRTINGSRQRVADGKKQRLYIKVPAHYTDRKKTEDAYRRHKSGRLGRLVPTESKVVVVKRKAIKVTSQELDVDPDV